MNTRVPVQFELPTAHDLPDETPYIPPATHNPEVAAARRQLSPGTLVLAQQHLGALTAELFVERMASGLPKEDTQFGSEIVAAAAFGSAQYSFRSGQPVMRRHLALPLLVDPESDNRMSLADRLVQTIGRFRLSTLRSEDVLNEILRMSKVDERTSHSFGRAAATAALWAALLPYPELGQVGSTLQVQRQVRQVGMDTLENAKRLNRLIGNRVSFAMLGGPTTKLSAFVEGSAPHGAYNAFRDARAEAESLISI